MASVFTVLTKLQADVSNFQSGMAKAQASLDKLEKAAASTGGNMDKNLTKQANKAAGGLGKLKGAFGLAAAAGAAFAGINYVKGAVGAASAFEAEFIGVEQTFGSASQVVKDFAENAAATAGLSETSALRYAKSFGGFASSAGLASDAQAKFSTTLVQTAGDLGSFFDLPTEDALNAISQGLRGEYEGLRRFNILLDDHTLKQVAMNEGIFNGTGEMSQQQKVLARQAAILQQVGVAQNDFTNYSDTYGNSIKTVGALMQNLSADVGAALLPSMAKLAQAIIPVVEALGPILGDVIKALIPVIEAVTSSLEPLIEAFEPIIRAIEPIANVFAELIENFLPPLIEVFGMVADIVYDLVTALEPLAVTLLQLSGDVLHNVTMPILRMFADIITNFVIPAIEFMADIIGKYIMPVISGLGEVFQDFVLPAIQRFGEWLNQNLPGMQKIFEDVFQGIGDAIQWTWNNVLKPVFGWLADALGIDMSAIGESFTKGFEKGAAAYNLNKNLSDIGDDKRLLNLASASGKSLGGAVAGGVVKGLDTVGGKGGGKSAAKTISAFKKLFMGFADDIKQQEAKITLASMGLSNALIETILGDSDWQQIYDRIIKGGAKTAKNLQNSFNKTTEGIAELNAEFKKFTENATEFSADIKSMFDGFKILPTIENDLGRFESQIVDLADNAREKLASGLSLKLITAEQVKTLGTLVAAHEKSMREIAKQRDALDQQLLDAIAVKEYGKQFRTTMTEVLQSVMPLRIATEFIGEFENATIASFNAVEMSIREAVTAGYLTDDLSKSMRQLASTTQTQLRGVAKQRDQLAREYQFFVEKLNSAKEFRNATRDAALGYANITSLGTSARTIIKNFGVMVQRTETFRQQLSTLNQMGLNRELYNQILNSGLDAGSATAKALLKGGPKAVAEVNSLFSKLDMTATRLADDTTKVMFDGGETAIQGFIDGIVLKDEALRIEAEKIASTFTQQFQFTLDTADTNIDAMIASIKAKQVTLEATAVTLANAFNTAFSGAVTAAVAVNTPSSTANPPAAAEVSGRKRATIMSDLNSLAAKIANAERYIANMTASGKTAIATSARGKLAEYNATKSSLIAEYNAAKFATGGMIRGSGSGMSDSIPAMLSNGEFVMRASAVEKFGSGFMSAINSGRVPAFATGGAVGTARIVTGGNNRTVINNKYEINVRTGIGDPAAIGKQVVSAIAAYQKTSGRQILG